MLQQGRRLQCLFRLPSIEKAENRLRHRAGHAVQQVVMPLGADAEAGACILDGFAVRRRVFAAAHFAGDAQQILGVVAEEAGGLAAGALDRRGQEHHAGKQLALLVCCAEHFHRRHLPIGSQTQAPLHLDGGPAGTLQRALCGERIIAPHERLQNHFTTSQSVKSITPCTICARKNIGWMFSGSE